MTKQRSLRTVALAMLLLASVGAWLHAQEKTDKQPPAAKEGSSPAKGSVVTPRPDRPLPTGEAAKGETAPQSAQGLGPFGKVLPVGEKNLDVKIPSFKDGVPTSTIVAKTMMRLDDENMGMEGMVIRLYGESHDKDLRISLITANYHMPSQILSSDKRSRVSRNDFDLQGDSMIFDTRTRQGTMTGNVRMVISDAGSFVPQKKDGDSSADSDKPDANDKKPADNEKPAAPTPTTPTSPPSNEKK